MKTLKTYIVSILFIFAITSSFAFSSFNVNHALPYGVVFQLKIENVSPSMSDKITDVFVTVDKRMNDDGTSTFRAGQFRNYENATVMENTMRFEGFSKVEVMAYFNQRSISIDDARTLLDNHNEVEEADVMETAPIISAEEMKRMLESRTTDHEFYYTVQIDVFSHYVADQLLDALDEVPVNIKRTDEYEYRIGKMTNMSEAKNIRAQLEEVGINGTYVTAYLDDERISNLAAATYEKYFDSTITMK